MKNIRMSVKLSAAIFLINTLCVSLLYFFASATLTTSMKKTELENLHDSLKIGTNIIEEFVKHQEDLLISFSTSSEVRDFLKAPDDSQKKQKAQEYTEKYYSQLDNWEGLYIGEWSTHVIAHSNPDIIGMTTREGEPLKQLQNAMLENNGLYNAGIIVSPASQKLILSLYCPVFDYDEKTIVGYVGGGPFAQELDIRLNNAKHRNASYYMVNAETNMYIFAQDENLIATEIKDDTFLSITSQFTDEQSTWNGDKEYTNEEKGSSLAAYQYIPEYKWAVISCNSQENIYADIDTNMRFLAGICIMSIIVITIFSWCVINLNTKPLNDFVNNT